MNFALYVLIILVNYFDELILRNLMSAKNLQKMAFACIWSRIIWSRNVIAPHSIYSVRQINTWKVKKNAIKYNWDQISIVHHRFSWFKMSSKRKRVSVFGCVLVNFGCFFRFVHLACVFFSGGLRNDRSQTKKKQQQWVQRRRGNKMDNDFNFPVTIHLSI